MNIYEFAMQMERDGERFYRSLADKAESAGIKRILTLLADDEVKHYDAVKKMAEEASPEMADTEILSEAKTIFADMQSTALDLGGAQVDLYRQAQDIERKSQEFYVEQAEQAANPAHEALFARIADEEKRHYLLLDNVIEFLSRPQTWIENAEFTHLDEY